MDDDVGCCFVVVCVVIIVVIVVTCCCCVALPSGDLFNAKYGGCGVMCVSAEWCVWV